MIVYLATDAAHEKWSKDAPNILISFAYITKQCQFIHNHQNFLLDSGAFTFMQKFSGDFDMDSYVDRYCEFINTEHVQNFIEMDVDYVLGMNEARRLRNLIERKTQKQTIPCWHLIRGKDAWIDICKNYPYASISLSGKTTTSRWFKKLNYKPLQWFLDVAAENDCKVHGLGFTNTKLLHKYKFYSVDSSTWIFGRYGNFFNFNGRIMDSSSFREKGRTVYDRIMTHNTNEWIKFVNYAKDNL